MSENLKRITSAERMGKRGIKDNKKFSFRNSFEKLLGKLNENATMESGFKELQSVIRNNTSPDDLRVYLNSLSSCINISTLNAKERIVLLFGYVASVFKENLIDPLEKDLITTIRKIIEIIKHFMKENSFGIHLACSNTLIELYNCFILSNNSDKEQLILQIFFDPLIQIISTGASKYAQSAAIICLSEMCKHLAEEKNILEEIYKKIIGIILKKKSISEYTYLFNCLYTLIRSINFDLIQRELPQILIKLEENVNSSSITRTEICKCLGIIGEKLLKESEEIMRNNYSNEIISALQLLSKDRTLNVVTNANKSLKVWLAIKRIVEENENKTNPKRITNQDVVIKSKSFSKLNYERDFSKLNKCSTPEMERDEIYSKGITNLLRTSDFLKKKDREKPFNTVTKFFVKKDKIKWSLEQFKHGIKSKIENNLQKSSNDFESNEDPIKINNTYLKINEGKQPIETKDFLQLLRKSALESFDSLCANFLNGITLRLDNTDKKLKTLEKRLSEMRTKQETSHKCDKNIKITENLHKNVAQSTEGKRSNKIDKNNNTDINEKTSRETEIIQSEVILNTLGKNDSEVNHIWNEALHFLKANNINSAYSRLLNTNDDLYLLRLLFLTGPVLNLLNIDNSKKLLLRINLISRSHQIESLIYKLIEQSYDLNVFLYLEEDFQNSILDTLYEYSLFEDTEIGRKSDKLYSMITSTLTRV